MVGEDVRLLLTPSFPGTKETGFYAQYKNEHWTKAAKVAYTHSEARRSFNQKEVRLLINLIVVIDGDKQEWIGATKKCVQTHAKAKIESRLNYFANRHLGFGDSHAGNTAS